MARLSTAFPLHAVIRVCVIGILGITASCNRGDLSGGTDYAALRQSEGGPGEPEPSGCTPPDPADLPVKINEILIENATVLQDATGEFPAWIELYNPSAEAVDLGGVALSDSLLEPQKWTFPCEAESIIESQGFLLVFLDGRDEIVGGEIHAAFSPQELAEGNFILNRTSDLIVFSAADLETDRSVGRFPDGARAGKLVPLLSPTPGAANDAPVTPLESRFIRGDTNEDGRVNVSDFTLLLAMLFQAEPFPSCEDRLDVNDDGAIDTQDSTHQSSALFLGTEVIPPPFPRLGFDPTDDDLSCPP